MEVHLYIRSAINNPFVSTYLLVSCLNFDISTGLWHTVHLCTCERIVGASIMSGFRKGCFILKFASCNHIDLGVASTYLGKSVYRWPSDQIRLPDCSPPVRLCNIFFSNLSPYRLDLAVMDVPDIGLVKRVTWRVYSDLSLFSSQRKKKEQR